MTSLAFLRIFPGKRDQNPPCPPLPSSASLTTLILEFPLQMGPGHTGWISLVFLLKPCEEFYWAGEGILAGVRHILDLANCCRILDWVTLTIMK